MRAPLEEAQRFIIAGIVIIAVAVVGLGVWAAMAPLHGAVMAMGSIKVERHRKTVQHLEGGIVQQILVKEGEVVKEGQPLFILEDEPIKASVDLLSGQIAAETAAIARLTAEKNEQAKIDFPAALVARAKEPAVAKVMESERRFFKAKRETLQSQIDLLRNQITQTKEEIAGLGEQLSSNSEVMATLTEQLQSNKSLLKEGYVPKTVVLELEKQWSEKGGRQAELSAAIAKNRQKIGEMELRIEVLRSGYVQDAAKELKEAEAKRLDLTERIRPPKDALERTTITAPIEGRVVDLRVYTAGGVIAGKEPLLDIVPLKERLIVEARINVDDIDDIHPGLEASIRLTAFKQRITPVVKGSVTYVSADSLKDQDIRFPPYYLTYIEIDDQSLLEAGSLQIYPGMAVQVMITTKKRTAMDYFLSPLTDYTNKAFREP